MKCPAQSCPTLCNAMDCSFCPSDSPGKNTGVGSRSLLQGIFLIQGSNLGLPHCRLTLYHLSHQGIPVKSLQIINAREDVEKKDPFLFTMIIILNFHKKYQSLSRKKAPNYGAFEVKEKPSFNKSSFSVSLLLK